MPELNPVLDTVPLVQKNENVEGRLWRTLESIAVTEGNVVLLSTLKSRGLATNDIRHFINKQTIHKKVVKSVDA